MMELKKGLNLIDVFSITVGAMMSSGLFILPGLAHAQVGPAMLLAYLLAGALATTGMLSQAELASAMPKAGGTYFYVTRSMGSAVGTVYGLITLLALALKSAFELMGMAVFTSLIVDIDIRIIAISLCLIFIFINIIGVKGAGRIQVGLVCIILTVLVVYIGRGLQVINVQHFQPFTPHGLWGVVATAGFVFVSYGGLLKVASIAEEVKDPGRVLPLAMILSLLVVAVVYTLVIFITIGVLGGNILNNTLTPISDGAGIILGPWGRIVLSVVAIFAFISATNAGIMGASRYPLALSRDKLLPSFLGRVNRRFCTPHYAILITGLIMVVALFLNLTLIVKAASCILILTYLFPCLAVIIMRESHIQNYQPRFRAPLYPWTQIIGTLGFAFLLFQIDTQVLLISAGLIFCGLFVYWFYGRIRSAREYALLHVIERITAKELTSHTLETELKDIIKERDVIIKDRFDEIVEKCTVLDIKEAMSLDEFSKLVAAELADHLKMQPEIILKLLLERERDIGIVLTPGIAVPHIIIEGEHIFDVLLARCKEGIAFSESAPKVHAVFVLIGSRDERSFHLRALAAIAQIIMDPHFEQRWMRARSKESLRDIVLLGKRNR